MWAVAVHLAVKVLNKALIFFITAMYFEYLHPCDKVLFNVANEILAKKVKEADCSYGSLRTIF